MPFNYKPYPAYKDSGVEWLGQVPEHWDTSYLRYLFNFGKGLTITKANLVDEGIPCVSYGEVHSKFGFEVNPDIHELKCVAESYLNTSPAALLTKGDFVFADTSEDLEGSGNFTQLTSEVHVFAGYHTIIARSITDAHDRFLAYLLDSQEFRTQIQLAVKGVKVFSITQAILRSAFAWLPSVDEQKQIASFLDQETSKIDSLIEKQQKLIELLKEKRQAVISHAVTKGLNPSAKMKDSGIQWLGHIPEHWILKRLKFNFRLMSEKVEIVGQPVIALENIESGSGKFIKTDSNYSGQDVAFTKGDVLFGKLRPYLAKVFECTGDGVGFGDILVYRPEQHMNSGFGFYSLLNESFIRIVDSSTYGAKMPRASSEFIGEMPLAVPPVSEQKEIANYLNDQTQKIDTLIDKSQQAIELLKERKTALISAAVTGKIDVRGYA